MIRYPVASLLLYVCVLLPSCESKPVFASPWHRKAKSISPGAKRSDVEALLPPSGASSCKTIQGGSRGLSYWVDPLWKVVVFYDYTGVPRDEEGRALSTDSPDNRLLAPIRLYREDMPEPIQIQDVFEKPIQTAEPMRATAGVGRAADARPLVATQGL